MSRRGLSRVELIVLLTIAVLLASLGIPAVIAARDHARRQQCLRNLERMGLALHQYHDAYNYFPPAATWHPGRLNSLMLDQNRRIDLFTYQNWAQLLLPYLDRQDLAQRIDLSQPIAAPENEAVRTTLVPDLTCPSDSWNTRENFYRFEPFADGGEGILFARGNYAINGGTHCHRTRPGTSARPRGDGFTLELDEEQRIYRPIGSGIAGINHYVSRSDLMNGQSTLVAIEELRAGIHPLDPRGVWSLGQIGGSMTWGHGVTGDDGAPNHQGDRADDLLGCGRLHQLLGKETLMQERMPCVHYIDRNDQATSRSLHPDGVHLLLADGAARFVHDRVDRGLWHVMHSRETPPELLADRFEERVAQLEPPDDQQPSEATTNSVAPATPGEQLTNSLGMTFIALPAGEFMMGVADLGNDHLPLPPECPPHRVRITRNFWLGQHEVNQAAFETVMGTNPSQHRDSADSGQFPVEQVTWHDAVEFCHKLSELPAEKAAGRHYRLPTEAEWEYACRAGKSDAYPWRSGQRKEISSGDNGGLEPSLPITRIASYAPNEWGLYDLRGNVWEWCSDWFDRAYYSRSPVDDPQGPGAGYLKVLRGNDWIFVGESCRINSPIMLPWKANPFVGFRVVCDVQN